VFRSSEDDSINPTVIITAARELVQKSIDLLKDSLKKNLGSEEALGLMGKAEQDGVLQEYLQNLCDHAVREGRLALRNSPLCHPETSSLMRVLAGGIVGEPLLEGMDPEESKGREITQSDFKAGLDRMDDVAEGMKEKALSNLSLENKDLLNIVKSYSVVVMTSAGRNVGVKDPGYYQDYIVLRGGRYNENYAERGLAETLDALNRSGDFGKEADRLSKDFGITPRPPKTGSSPAA